MAVAMIKEGANVVVVDRDESIARLAGELGAADAVFPITGDVTDYAAMQRVARQSGERFGRVE